MGGKERIDTDISPSLYSTYCRNAVTSPCPASNLSSSAKFSFAAGPISPVRVGTLGHVAGLLFLVGLGGAGEPSIDLSI